MDNWQDKTILILGFAREGQSAYKFLRAKFPEKEFAIADQADQIRQADLLVQDTGRVKVFTGDNYLASVKDFDIIIKSAGVPTKLVLPHLKSGAVLTSATQLFFEQCPGTIIGVTGTKGKSTTTSVIYEVLKQSDKPTILCGNIGIPALDQLPNITKNTLVVMELSSHQLQSVTKSPHIAVLQNIVPEHLDYYENFDEYVAAKANITKFQTEQDYLLFNAAYDIPTNIAKTSRAQKIPFNTPSNKTGCYSKDGIILYCTNGNEEEILEESGIQLPGKYNIQNVMPAVIIGKMYSVPSQKIAEAISNFKGLTDRMEFVGEINGVKYYNDSLATVPESAIGALDALGDTVQTILVGGFDRGLDFTELGKRIAHSKIETVISFPTTGKKIWQAVENELGSTEARELGSLEQESRMKEFAVESMAEAVKIAKERTDPGRVVLLSPASPSFGVFKDYHDRGAQFKKAVLANNVS